MTVQRAWIFANGTLDHPQAVAALLTPGDTVIAADGGGKHLRQLGIRPQLVIGDLDSLPKGELELLAAGSAKIQKFPVEKDETDLELAIQAALDLGSRSIRIAGALGGRFDQELGNLFLLARPDLAECDVRLEDGQTEVFLIRREARLEGQPGDTVSLLPLGGAAGGVHTEGLRYPLYGEPLYPERTRGISNELTASQAHVSLESGVLICVHIRTKG